LAKLTAIFLIPDRDGAAAFDQSERTCKTYMMRQQGTAGERQGFGWYEALNYFFPNAGSR
jgi:hypothetical protein